jgi:hypothetical protein
VLKLFWEGRLNEDRAVRFLERAYSDAEGGVETDFHRITEDHLDD